jgi:hypothetical protein
MTPPVTPSTIKTTKIFFTRLDTLLRQTAGQFLTHASFTQAAHIAMLDSELQINHSLPVCEKARRAKNAMNFPTEKSTTDGVRTNAATRPLKLHASVALCHLNFV